MKLSDFKFYFSLACVAAAVTCFILSAWSYREMMSLQNVSIFLNFGGSKGLSGFVDGGGLFYWTGAGQISIVFERGVYPFDLSVFQSLQNYTTESENFGIAFVMLSPLPLLLVRSKYLDSMSVAGWTYRGCRLVTRRVAALASTPLPYGAGRPSELGDTRNYGLPMRITSTLTLITTIGTIAALGRTGLAVATGTPLNDFIDFTPGISLRVASILLFGFVFLLCLRRWFGGEAIWALGLMWGSTEFTYNIERILFYPSFAFAVVSNAWILYITLLAVLFVASVYALRPRMRFSIVGAILLCIVIVWPLTGSLVMMTHTSQSLLTVLRTETLGGALNILMVLSFVRGKSA